MLTFSYYPPVNYFDSVLSSSMQVLALALYASIREIGLLIATLVISTFLGRFGIYWAETIGYYLLNETVTLIISSLPKGKVHFQASGLQTSPMVEKRRLNITYLELTMNRLSSKNILLWYSLPASLPYIKEFITIA